MSTPPNLQPGCEIGKTLRAMAAYLLKQGQGIVDDPKIEGTKAVHDFRRLMKRWRSMLRLLSPWLEGENGTLREDARTLARRLSVARDAQSAIDAFHDASENPAKDIPALSGRTLASIQHRLEELRTSNEKVGWNKPLKREMSVYVTTAAAQAARWPVDEVTFADLAERLARTYRRARRAIPEDWETVAPEDLHELRRRVIEHRYQMELVEPAWPRFGRMWVEEAQRLRSRLGAYQDLEMLRALTAPHRPLARWRSRLLPIIAARQADHAKSAARVAARLFAEPPKAFRRRIEAIWEGQAE
jgi:CHAD domain-containing protein